MNRREVSETYARARITFDPGERLHHLAAMLCDTHYDDLTVARIRELEDLVAAWRWTNAAGEQLG